MIQDVITYLIITVAMGYTGYNLLGVIGIVKKKGGCNCGGGSCKIDKAA